MTKISDNIRIVDEAITSRRSVRAFLPTPVARATIEEILDVAGRAPSGTNTQPWKVYVLTGVAKESLSQKILDAHADPEVAPQHRDEYKYYPVRWTSPYLDRRRKIGWDMYGLLGLTRENKAGIWAQARRNYSFFDAPVGLMFTIDRILEQGSWLDYGMFLQNIMIAARARGLDTCPQAAFMQFHRIIATHLKMPETEMLVCGMSLGYADTGHVVNRLQTERETVAGFAVFMD